MTLTSKQTVPVLRSFDEAKAREFYIDFLGFKVDWEHRFEPDLPLYMQVSRGGLVFHLSEHHGDGSPGARVRVACEGVRALQSELIAKRYKNNRPGIEHPPWGGIECTVIDPAGNKITFAEADPKPSTKRTDRASLVVRASAERIYRAFVDPAALVEWLPPRGMKGTIRTFEPRPGGRYAMVLRYDDPSTPGKTGANTDVVAGRFLELVDGVRVVQEVAFDSDDPAFAGMMKMTWSLAPTSQGTEVTFLCEDVPEGIRKEDHDAGLQSSLRNLATFTEQTDRFAGARAMAFVATAKAAESRAFYTDVVGLRFLEETDFAIVFEAFGATLRVQKVDTVVVAPYTSFGIQVRDLATALDRLAERGIPPIRYPFLDQDPRGIWTSPSGARIAWISDPDRNVVSFAELEP